MNVIIYFDHAVNDFEIDGFIDTLKENPAINKIEKINDSHCGKCKDKK